MLKVRIVTALALLLLFLLALFLLPALGWAALIIILVQQGTAEWVRLAGFSARFAQIYWWLTLAFMLILVWSDMQHPEYLKLLHLLIYALSALLWLLVVPIWLISGRQFNHPLLLLAGGWIVLIPTGVAMMDLREYSPWALLGVMGLVWMADISAYFSGRKFGKKKLAPSISPGKTWEGVIGALFGVAVYVLLIAYFTDVLPTYKVLPVVMLVAWFWVALAVLGDLFESAIKRQAGVKDSGALLPGHGGLLDRVDALTPTLPLAAMLLLLQSMV